MSLDGIPLSARVDFLLAPLGSLPVFQSDYLHQLRLPHDWDPKGHLKGTGTWRNPSGFWDTVAGLPVAPTILPPEADAARVAGVATL